MDNRCKGCQWESENNRRIDGSLSSSEWAEITGVISRSIRRHKRNHADRKRDNNQRVDPPGNTGTPGLQYRWEVGPEAFDGQSRPTDAPVSNNDVEQFLIERGLNPKEWEYTFRFSEWEQNSKEHGMRVLNAFKVSGRRKTAAEAFSLEDSHITHIRTLSFLNEPKQAAQESMIIVPADAQIGKTDWNGGTKETISQIIHSFHKASKIAEQTHPTEIVIIDAGDIVENIYNTSSQLATNDLGLPWQIVAAVEVILRGIEMVAPHTNKITYIAVPSNHGSHRIGKQSAAGTVMDDWGLAVAKLVKIAAPQITLIVPGEYHESVYYETSGTQLGVVHGHQAGSPDRIGEWWKGQSHGNLPVSKARILITGHWHSFRVQQSGDARWIFVAPSSDRGSSWFTNVKGEQSKSGVLVFITHNNHWRDIQIL